MNESAVRNITVSRSRKQRDPTQNYKKFENGFYIIKTFYKENEKEEKEYLLTQSIRPKEHDENKYEPVYAFVEENNYIDENQLFYFYQDESIDSYIIFNPSDGQCLGFDSKNSQRNIDILPQNLSFNNSCQWKIVITDKKDEYLLQSEENQMYLGKKSLSYKQIEFDEKQIALQVKEKSIPIQLKKFTDFKKVININPSKIQKWKYRAEHFKISMTKKEIEFNNYSETITKDDIMFYQNATKVIFTNHTENIKTNAFDHLQLNSLTCTLNTLTTLKNPFMKEKYFNSLEYIKLIKIENVDDINCLNSFTNLKTIEIDSFINELQPIENESIKRIISHPKWFEKFNKENVEELIIPTWVTDVKELKCKDFEGYTNVTSLIIPSTIQYSERINYLSFHLKQLQCCANSLQNLATSGVTSVTVGSNDKQIDEIDMKFFSQIQRLILPSQIECDENAFSFSTNLKEVHCHATTLKYFTKNELQTIYIDENTTQIEKNQFQNFKQLKKLILPRNIETIENDTFSKCLQLTSVKCNIKHIDNFNKMQLIELSINEGCNTFYQKTFDTQTNLTKLKIPTTITFIEENTFQKLTNLKSIHTPINLLPHFETIEITELIVPNGVTKILKNEIDNCLKIQSIHLPKSVLFIESDAFDNCHNLIDIDCDPQLFYRFTINEFHVPRTMTYITKGIFNNWATVRKLVFEGSNITIDSEAFEGCGSLIEIEIKGWIKEIKPNAFKNCLSLRKLKIEGSVDKIELSAFQGCINLKEFECNNQIKEIFTRELRIRKWEVVNIDDYSHFKNVIKIRIAHNAKLENPEQFFQLFDSLKCIHCLAKYLPFIKNKEKIETIYLSKHQTKIPMNNFKGFTNVKFLYLPLMLETIYMSKEENDIFSQMNELTFVQCRLKQLDFFNKTQMKMIIIHGENEKLPNDDPFTNCIQLEHVILPINYKTKSDKYFKNCNKLKLIEFTNGDKIHFRKPYTVPVSLEEINDEEFKLNENVNKLIIPHANDFIKQLSFDHMNEIEEYIGDPKWLSQIHCAKIKSITIPSFVKDIDLSSFVNCILLKELHFENLTFDYLCEFPKDIEITTLKCSMYMLKKIIKVIPSMLKTVKIIYIVEGTKVIEKDCFNKFDNLQEIHLPQTIETIKPMSINGCKHLEKLFINCLLKTINETLLCDCPKLRIIKCQLEFLKNFDSTQIQQLEITNQITRLKSKYLQQFNNLQRLQLPQCTKSISTKIIETCPKLNELRCSYELYEQSFKKLDENDQKKFKIIEFPYDKDKQIIINNYYKIDGIQKEIDSSILQNKQKTSECKISHHSKIDFMKEVMESESIGIFYNDLLHIFYELKTFNWTFEQYKKKIKPQKENKELNEISHHLIEMLKDLKDKKFKQPYPTQIFSILKLAYEIQFGKDIQIPNSKISKQRASIAEVKTGEGKSLIIALTALLLSKYYGRSIDIITQNISLARRDQEEFKSYFKECKIKSGVLYNLKNDFKFIEKTRREKLMKIKNKLKWRSFNTDVFEKQIVYSTSSNFEQIYLKELFSPHLLREIKNEKPRKYDVIIIDEVDTMLIDQNIEISSLYQQIPTYFASDILSLVYEFRDETVDNIQNILNYYFYEGGNFERGNVIKMKYAAQQVQEMEKGVDYVVENVKMEIEEEYKNIYWETQYKPKIKYQKDVIIIDKNTGFKLPKYHLDNYIHEMLQIKEKIPMKEPHLTSASIIHSSYIKLYSGIIGVTGTIGDYNDLHFLKTEYNIEPFIIPRYFKSQQILIEKQRPKNEKELFDELKKEVEMITYYHEKSPKQKYLGRPVLIIVDSLKRLKQLQLLFSDCQIIDGIHPEKDKEAIEKAGEKGRITIATLAAARGIDIKLSNSTLHVKGLHVIIPYKLPSYRLFEQAIGRSGRKGEPGSVTIYVDSNDTYDVPDKLDSKYKILQQLQETFSQYLKNDKEFKWILYAEKLKDTGFYRRYKSRQKYPFGISINDFFELCDIFIENRVLHLDDFFYYTSYVREMVMISWSMFYNQMIELIDTSKENDEHIEKVIETKYNKYIENLKDAMRKRYTDKKQYEIKKIKSYFERKGNKKFTKYATRFFCVNILGTVITTFFGPLPGIIYQLTSEFILDMGFDIALIIINGGKIDWKIFVKRLKRRSMELGINSILSPIVYTVTNFICDDIGLLFDDLSYSFGLINSDEVETTREVMDNVTELYVEECVDVFIDLFLLHLPFQISQWISEYLGIIPEELIDELKNSREKKKATKSLTYDSEEKMKPEERIQNDMIIETLINELRNANKPNSSITHKMRLTIAFNYLKENYSEKVKESMKKYPNLMVYGKYEIQQLQFNVFLLEEQKKQNYFEISEKIEDMKIIIRQQIALFYANKIFTKGYHKLQSIIKRALFRIISNEDFSEIMKTIGLKQFDKLMEELKLLQLC